jgi:hypothetical protein
MFPAWDLVPSVVKNRQLGPILRRRRARKRENLAEYLLTLALRTTFYATALIEEG